MGKKLSDIFCGITVVCGSTFKFSLLVFLSISFQCDQLRILSIFFYLDNTPLFVFARCLLFVSGIRFYHRFRCTPFLL